MPRWRSSSAKWRIAASIMADLLRMVRDVAAFVLDLAQRHHGVGWGIAQDLEVVAELIAEHQQKRLGHGLT